MPSGVHVAIIAQGYDSFAIILKLRAIETGPDTSCCHSDRAVVEEIVMKVRLPFRA